MDLRLVIALPLLVVVFAMISYYLSVFLRRGGEFLNSFFRETLISKSVGYKLKPLAMGSLKLFAYSTMIYIFLLTLSLAYLATSENVYIFEISAFTDRIVGVVLFSSMILLSLIFITLTLIDIYDMFKRRRDISREIFVKKLIGYTIVTIILIAMTTFITIDLKKGIETIQHDLNSLISQL